MSSKSIKIVPVDIDGKVFMSGQNENGVKLISALLNRAVKYGQVPYETACIQLASTELVSNIGQGSSVHRNPRNKKNTSDQHFMPDPVSINDKFMFAVHSVDTDTNCEIYLNPVHSGYLDFKDYLFNELTTPVYVEDGSEDSKNFCGDFFMPTELHHIITGDIKTLGGSRMIPHAKIERKESNRSIISIDEAISLLAHQKTSEQREEVSVGIDYICFDTSESKFARMIPYIVNEINTVFGMYGNSDNDNVPVSHRLIYCDYTRGERYRVFNYNANNMAHWMKLLSGEVVLFWAPLTDHNENIFQDYIQGKIDITDSDFTFIRLLHFVIRHVLHVGDTIFIPPNSIVFEFTDQHSSILRGDFFSGVCLRLGNRANELFYSYRHDDYLSVYHQLAKGTIAICKEEISTMYLGRYTYSNLLKFFLNSLEHINYDRDVRMFNYSRDLSNAKSLSAKRNRHNAIMSFIKLQLTNAISTIFMNTLVLYEGDNEEGAPDAFLALRPYPEHALSKPFDANRSRYYIVHDGRVHQVDVNTLGHSILNYIATHLADAFPFCKHPISASECDSLSTTPCQPMKLIENSSADKKDDGYKLDFVRFIGTIGDYDLTLDTFFSIFYFDITTVSRKLNTFVTEYRDKSFANIHTRGYDAFMHVIPNLRPETKLTVYEIMSYLYCNAKHNEINRFYHFVDTYLEYNVSGAYVPHDDMPFLVYPISVHRQVSRDEWIVAFINKSDIDGFKIFFNRDTKLLHRRVQVHNDKGKGISHREWCAYCTKFVLVIMESPDCDMCVIRCHKCSHVPHSS